MAPRQVVTIRGVRNIAEVYYFHPWCGDVSSGVVVVGVVAGSGDKDAVGVHVNVFVLQVDVRGISRSRRRGRNGRFRRWAGCHETIRSKRVTIPRRLRGFHIQDRFFLVGTFLVFHSCPGL